MTSSPTGTRSSKKEKHTFEDPIPCRGPICRPSGHTSFCANFAVNFGICLPRSPSHANRPSLYRILEGRLVLDTWHHSTNRTFHPATAPPNVQSTCMEPVICPVHSHPRSPPPAFVESPTSSSHPLFTCLSTGALALRSSSNFPARSKCH
ncbi:hypothetical protein OF83DRAFT_823719 [Amylostereum chailletii]|nr:hypothetical protein OF83DRAFT_823719 [Amylostereum chailletii]